MVLDFINFAHDYHEARSHKVLSEFLKAADTVKITSFDLFLLIMTNLFFCVLWLFRHIFMRKFFWLDILTAQ